MPKCKTELLLVTFLTLFCSLSFASASDKSIDKLLDLSGLTKQVKEFPGLVKTGMEQARQQGAAIPEDLFSKMTKSVDKSILPSEILDGIRSSLKKTICEDEAKKLLKWFESDLGRKITVAEEDASTPKAYQQMMGNAQALLTDSKRVEIAKRLDKLLGATDMAMNIQKYSGLAVYSAIMTAVAPGQPLNIEAYKSQMLAMEPQMRTNIEQLVIISFIYSYKTIDDKSLNKYEVFLNNSTTVKFYNAVMESMNKGFETATSKWAIEIGSIFKDKVNKANSADAKSRAAD